MVSVHPHPVGKASPWTPSFLSPQPANVSHCLLPSRQRERVAVVGSLPGDAHGDSVCRRYGARVPARMCRRLLRRHGTAHLHALISLATCLATSLRCATCYASYPLSTYNSLWRTSPPHTHHPPHRPPPHFSTLFTVWPGLALRADNATVQRPLPRRPSVQRRDRQPASLQCGQLLRHRQCERDGVSNWILL